MRFVLLSFLLIACHATKDTKCGAFVMSSQQAASELGEPCPEGTEAMRSMVGGTTQWWCEGEKGVRHGPFKSRVQDCSGVGTTKGRYLRGMEEGRWEYQGNRKGFGTTSWQAQYSGGKLHGLCSVHDMGFDIEMTYDEGIPNGDYQWTARECLDVAPHSSPNPSKGQTCSNTPNYQCSILMSERGVLDGGVLITSKRDGDEDKIGRRAAFVPPKHCNLFQVPFLE